MTTHHTTHISLRREGHVRHPLRHKELLTDKRLAVRLHLLHLLIRQHVQQVLKLATVLSFTHHRHHHVRLQRIAGIHPVLHVLRAQRHVLLLVDQVTVHRFLE